MSNYSGLREGGKKGLTMQGGFQSRKDRQTLFAQRGQVPTDAAEENRPLGAAEGTGHFLLHFDHADIPFGKIVVKRNIQALQEEQDRLLVFAQSIQQVACRMLLGFATFALWSGDGRMHLISLCQQSQETETVQTDPKEVLEVSRARHWWKGLSP